MGEPETKLMSFCVRDFPVQQKIKTEILVLCLHLKYK